MNRSGALRQFWKTKVDPNAPIKIAQIPQKRPYIVSLEAHKSYCWCSCGLSTTQPFCNGAHKAYNEKHNANLKPVQFTAEKTKKVMLCGCKHTGNEPFCDFSHVGVLFRHAVGIDKPLPPP